MFSGICGWWPQPVTRCSISRLCFLASAGGGLSRWRGIPFAGYVFWNLRVVASAGGAVFYLPQRLALVAGQVL